MKSNSDMMGEAIDRSPYDEAARCAMQDALEEEGVGNALAAEIATVRVHLARQKYLHQQAARFIATRCKLRQRLNVVLRELTGLAASAEFTLILREGCERPSVQFTQNQNVKGWFYANTVFVGAEWVLKWRDDQGEAITERKCDMKRHLRRKRDAKGRAK